MKYKVLVLDIDGTLNNTQKEITPKTKRAIRQAQNEGVIIVIASGRPTLGMLHVAEELELSKYGGYLLSFNGGKITDCTTNEIIYEKNLPEGIVSEIYDISKEFGVKIITYSATGVITEQPDDEFIEIECRINRISVEKVDSFKDYVTFPIPKCLIVGEGDYIARIEPIVKARLGDRLNVFRSEPFFLEIMPQNIDKSYSLGKLLEHLGLTKDEMIACGDGFNDISMIRFAGLGVAMENAQPQVKEVADYITLSNNDDGIAQVIEKFILKKSLVRV